MTPFAHVAGGAATYAGDCGPRPVLPFELLESKLRPPPVNGPSIPRKRLLDRLNGAGEPPIVVAGAPAGYGKTTMLAQWTASREGPEIAWLSLDARDNDPIVLLAYVATALDRVTPLDDGVFAALGAPGNSIATTVVPRLGAALAAVEEPVALVLDAAHAITDRRCIEAIVELAAHVPEGSRLVLSTRDPSAFPVARWRGRAQVAELGSADLRMDEDEARDLLDATEAGCSDEEAAALVDRTEGWPAGLYLAALSARDRATAATPARALTGDDPFVAGFLRSELLASLSPEEIGFLTRTSVLEELSGPLCDALLQESGSGAMLEALARSNRFLVPLDADQTWYRCHRLVRDLLATELRRGDRDAVAPLLGRAFDWCAEHAREAAAIGYGQAAGDADRVAALVERCAEPAFGRGGSGEAEQWFRWLRRHGEPTRYPAVGVIAAVFHALRGQPAECDLWCVAAERGRRRAPLPDGSASLASWQAVLRAVRCRQGVERMHDDATLAVRTLAPTSPWRGPSLLLLGMSELARGRDDLADDRFADAAEAAKAFAAAQATPVVVAAALAERALAASERAGWVAAEAFAEQAEWTVRHGCPEGLALHALVHAVAARSALHHGREADASGLLAEAQRALPLLTHLCPVPAVQARLELAGAHLLLGDHANASAMSDEIEAVLRRCPDLGRLGVQARELRTRLGAPGHDVPGAAALTAAELRLLPLLATHLSYREIGEQRFLSRHTVKSHAMSIYRKLDVNSRNAAVQRARELGLL